jgi:beta-lactam-binding protein with PASTA domain
MADPDLLIGRTVDGRYRITDPIARGGMAGVYEAVDLRLDRVVALKVLHASMAEDPSFRERFQREARAAARLAHPHVVAIYDQGEDGDVVWLAMELVDGRTLRDVLREYGAIAPEQALALIEPVLEALGAAHDSGFVHRDVKPENILISDTGQVKVTDFGLARAVTAATVTTRSVLIGTVAYLAPEQVEPGTSDARSDVYAAGICLFEMLTGVVPYTGDTPLAVAYQHVNSEIPLPSTLRPTVPADVDALVRHATVRDPANRYPDARAMLADVRRIRATLPSPRPLSTDLQHTAVLPVDARPVAQAAATGTVDVAARAAGRSDGPEPPTARRTAARRARRRRLWPIVVGVLLLVAAVAGAAFAGWFFAAGPGRTVTVPGLISLSVDAARAEAAKVDLTVTVGAEEFSETVPAGRILSTDPEPGATVAPASTITLVVSRGPERFAVPAVAGKPVAEATAAIEAAGLRVGEVKDRFDEGAAAGTVLRTEPGAGEPLRRDTAVDVIVSKGPKPVEIPDVAGADIAVAESTLRDLGLVTDVVREYSDTVPLDAVISSAPAPGELVESGSSITLTVSDGPPPVEVPYLIDMIREDAVALIESLGLVVDINEPPITPLNRVISQDPSAGTLLPRGSTVTITIV